MSKQIQNGAAQKKVKKERKRNTRNKYYKTNGEYDVVKAVTDRIAIVKKRCAEIDEALTPDIDVCLKQLAQAQEAVDKFEAEMDDGERSDAYCDAEDDLNDLWERFCEFHGGEFPDVEVVPENCLPLLFEKNVLMRRLLFESVDEACYLSNADGLQVLFQQNPDELFYSQQIRAALKLYCAAGPRPFILMWDVGKPYARNHAKRRGDCPLQRCAKINGCPVVARFLFDQIHQNGVISRVSKFGRGNFEDFRRGIDNLLQVVAKRKRREMAMLYVQYFGRWRFNWQEKFSRIVLNRRPPEELGIDRLISNQCWQLESTQKMMAAIASRRKDIGEWFHFSEHGLPLPKTIVMPDTI